VDGAAFAGQAYKIFFEGSQVISGVLNAQGQARHDNVPQKAVKVEYEQPKPKKEAPWQDYAALVSAAQSSFNK
jgi:type VI secretion system secreted protein VgrG